MNKILTIALLLVVLMFIQSCKNTKVEVGQSTIIHEPIMTADKGN